MSLRFTIAVEQCDSGWIVALSRDRDLELMKIAGDRGSLGALIVQAADRIQRKADKLAQEENT